MSRREARPVAFVPVALCAAAAAWIKSANAAMLIGNAGNMARAAEIASSMMPARAMTPGTSSLFTPNAGFGLVAFLVVIVRLDLSPR